MIAGVSHGPLRLSLRLLHSALAPFQRLRHDAVGLMPMLRGQLAVPL